MGWERHRELPLEPGVPGATVKGGKKGVGRGSRSKRNAPETGGGLSLPLRSQSSQGVTGHPQLAGEKGQRQTD